MVLLWSTCIFHLIYWFTGQQNISLGFYNLTGFVFFVLSVNFVRSRKLCMGVWEIKYCLNRMNHMYDPVIMAR